VIGDDTDSPLQVNTHGSFARARVWTNIPRPGREPAPTAAIFDSWTLRGTPESGHRAGLDGHKKKRGSKIHLAVDTLGQLLALVVTPADA
jgi:hypothetical protein